MQRDLTAGHINFTWSARLCDFVQQDVHLLVGPVVEHPGQDVQVRFGQVILEEVSCSYKKNSKLGTDTTFIEG